MANLFPVTNDDSRIQKLIKLLKDIQPELIVLEATGGMETNAAMTLTPVGFAVAVINPRLGRDFAEAIRPQVREMSDESARTTSSPL